MPTSNVVGPAGMGGGGSAPVPWWQLPNQPQAANNLDASAPAGYQYDRVKMAYVPILGSATDALSQRLRQQSIEDRLLGALTGSFGASTGDDGGDYGSISGGSAPPPEAYGGVGGGSVPSFSLPPEAAPAPAATISAPDTSAAQAAIFARAKDKVGLETAGSLTALRSALAGRGLLGGGREVRGTSNVLTAGQQQLGDTTREGAIQEATRMNDFAKLGYQGAIEQRGQDITTSEGAANRALQAATTNYTGQITQRGQDVSGSEADYSGRVAQRGQDVSARATDLQGAIEQRGQDITSATARRGQNVNAVSSLLSRLY